MDRVISPATRRKELRKRLIKIAIPAGIAIGGIIACVSMMQTGIKRSSLSIGVADRGTLETSVAGSGRVAPAFEQIINSPIASRIVEVYCKEGDSVNAGTPLLRLDLQSAENELKALADERQHKLYELQQTRLNNHTYLTDLEMQVKVKGMALSHLQADVANERRLDSIGSGTGDRVRQAELAYETGRLELDQFAPATRQRPQREKRRTRNETPRTRHFRQKPPRETAHIQRRLAPLPTCGHSHLHHRPDRTQDCRGRKGGGHIRPVALQSGGRTLRHLCRPHRHRLARGRDLRPDGTDRESHQAHTTVEKRNNRVFRITRRR